MDLKKKIYHLLEDPNPDETGLKLRLAIQILILCNILSVILESVDTISAGYSFFFHGFEVFSVGVFSLEYLARLWSCIEGGKKRLKFLLSPYALVDLAAILPFYIALFAIDLRFLRALRLFRFARIAKMTRYWAALTLFWHVVQRKKEELASTFLIFFVFLIISSGLVYFAERGEENTLFTSIPAAMWWGIATMTTVGYGDIVPTTFMGKLIGGLTSIIGVIIFAIFAGVAVTGFSEEFKKRKVNKSRFRDTADQR